MALKHNIVLLCMAMESKPCLWDKCHEDYNNKIAKQNAWVEIFAFLDIEYMEKTQEEKKDIGCKIVSKWKNVRGAFMRSLKGKNGQAATKNYIYFQHLQFLLTSEVPINKISSLNDATLGASFLEESNDIIYDIKDPSQPSTSTSTSFLEESKDIKDPSQPSTSKCTSFLEKSKDIKDRSQPSTSNCTSFLEKSKDIKDRSQPSTSKCTSFLEESKDIIYDIKDPSQPSTSTCTSFLGESKDIEAYCQPSTLISTSFLEESKDIKYDIKDPSQPSTSNYNLPVTAKVKKVSKKITRSERELYEIGKENLVAVKRARVETTQQHVSIFSVFEEITKLMTTAEKLELQREVLQSIKAIFSRSYFKSSN